MGLRAFQARSLDRSAIYAYENRHLAELDEAHEAQLRATGQAWTFFNAQPPSYRKTATYWVVSAKREETRRRRLAQLIEDSANGRRLRQLTRPNGRRRHGDGRE